MSSLATVQVLHRWALVCLSYDSEERLKKVKELAEKMDGFESCNEKHLSGYIELEMVFITKDQAISFCNAVKKLFK